MQVRRAVWLTGLSAAWLLVLPGCRSAPSGAQAPARPSASQPARAAAEDASPEAAERRAEAHARYAQGWLHWLKGELAPALAAFQQAALLDPGNEALALEVSEQLLRARQPERALEVLTKATEQPGASAQLFARLAIASLLAGKTNAALAAARTAVERNPRAILGYQCLAQIHFQHRQRDEGLKVLAQAARQDKTDAVFLLDLAEMFIFMAGAPGDPKLRAQALEVLRRAEQLDIANPVLLQRLADAFGELGEADRATAAYAKMLERFPHLTEVRRRLADHYLRKADLTNAVAQIEALIKDNPADPRPYFVLGAITFEQRKPKEAIPHFRKALLLAPDYEPAYYELAAAQLSANEPKEALETLARARAKFDRTFQTEYFAGLAYSRLKDYSNAVQCLVAAEVIGRATATNRLNHIFYFQLGAAYERNQQYEEAEKTFRKVLALEPDFSEALNYLGYMWAERGLNLQEARQLIEKALQLQPKNAAYLDSMAWVLFKLGQPQEALSWMLKALEHLEEPDAVLYDHLGDIYAALQQPDKAREAWKKALELEPSDALRQKLGLAPATPAGTP